MVTQPYFFATYSSNRLALYFASADCESKMRSGDLKPLTNSSKTLTTSSGDWCIVFLLSNLDGLCEARLRSRLEAEKLFFLASIRNASGVEMSVPNHVDGSVPRVGRGRSLRASS